MKVRSVMRLEAMRTYQDSFVSSLCLKPFSFLKRNEKQKVILINLIIWICFSCALDTAKSKHPCQALKCQIWGSLKAAVCLIRSPCRAAQSGSSLSLHDLFFNKCDQDGSLCNALCCVSCSAAGRDDLPTLSAVLMSVWKTWRKQCLLIAFHAFPSLMGLSHSA